MGCVDEGVLMGAGTKHGCEESLSLDMDDVEAWALRPTPYPRAWL